MRGLARHARAAACGALWLPYRCDVEGFEPRELGDAEVAEGGLGVEVVGVGCVVEDAFEDGEGLQWAWLAAAARAQVVTALSHEIQQGRVGVVVGVAERYGDGVGPRREEVERHEGNTSIHGARHGCANHDCEGLSGHGTVSTAFLGNSEEGLSSCML